eukprot:gene22986-29781_t
MNIKRADVARYLLLLQFGGVYMDLDMELKGPIHPILEDISSYFGEFSTAENNNTSTTKPPSPSSSSSPSPPSPLLHTPSSSFSNYSFSTSAFSYPFLSANLSAANKKSIFITYISKEFEILNSAASSSFALNQRYQQPVFATTSTSQHLHQSQHSGPNTETPSQPLRFAGNAFMAATMGSPILSEIIGHIFNYSNPMGTNGLDVLRHTGPLGLGEVIHRLKEKGQVEVDAGGGGGGGDDGRNDDFYTAQVVMLGSSIVGNTKDKPSLAEHKRKHQWQR